MKKHAPLRLLSAAITLSALTSIAYAQDIGTGWIIQPVDLIPEHSLQIGMTGEFMSAQAKDQYGDPVPGTVTFICVNKELLVSISTENYDTSEFIDLWDNPGLRNTEATLIIDDERAGHKGYTWAKNRGQILPQSQAHRKKIYNAVLRKQAASVRWSRKGVIPLHLPPANEAFRNFGKECGMGVYGKGVKQDA